MINLLVIIFDPKYSVINIETTNLNMKIRSPILCKHCVNNQLSRLLTIPGHAPADTAGDKLG